MVWWDIWYDMILNAIHEPISKLTGGSVDDGSLVQPTQMGIVCLLERLSASEKWHAPTLAIQLKSGRDCYTVTTVDMKSFGLMFYHPSLGCLLENPQKCNFSPPKTSELSKKSEVDFKKTSNNSENLWFFASRGVDPPMTAWWTQRIHRPVG